MRQPEHDVSKKRGVEHRRCIQRATSCHLQYARYNHFSLGGIEAPTMDHLRENMKKKKMVQLNTHRKISMQIRCIFDGHRNTIKKHQKFQWEFHSHR